MSDDREVPQATGDIGAASAAEYAAHAPEADPAVFEQPISPLDELAGLRPVYALGTVVPQFGSLAVEKEFAQLAGREGGVGLTDKQALSLLLREPRNRYLVRELCWVFTIGGLETYILSPADPGEYTLLIDALRSSPRPSDVDIVIGRLGPMAPPEMCNALIAPIVLVDQLYSADVTSIVKSIPRPKGMKAEQFEPIAEELFMRIAQMTDNAGSTDEDRAVNYLSIRDPGTYEGIAQRIVAGWALSGIDVRPSRISALRNVVDVVFEYTERTRGVVEKDFVRVDVTEKYPFLVNPYQGNYIERYA
jgi:hypothetical protein